MCSVVWKVGSFFCFFVLAVSGLVAGSSGEVLVWWGFWILLGNYSVFLYFWAVVLGAGFFYLISVGRFRVELYSFFVVRW